MEIILDSPSATPAAVPTSAWNDEDLVEECLRGKEEAWVAIIEKYKGLVYCAAKKYRMSEEDAAGLFQQVWFDLYNELGKLRKPGAVGEWLIAVVWHKSSRWERRRLNGEPPVKEIPYSEWKEHAVRAQLLRDTVAQLPGCCQRMVSLLFQWGPPVAYADAARQLTLAGDRNGPSCGGCLDRLRTLLEQKGF